MFLDGAYVASEGLIGDANSGWQVATSVLADERAAVGAASIRLDRRLVDWVTTLEPNLRSRVCPSPFTRPIGHKPSAGPSLEACDDRVRTQLSRAVLDTHGADAMLTNDDTEPFCTPRGCALLEVQAKCNGILLANDCSAFHVHPNRRHLE